MIVAIRNSQYWILNSKGIIFLFLWSAVPTGLPITTNSLRYCSTCLTDEAQLSLQPKRTLFSHGMAVDSDHTIKFLNTWTQTLGNRAYDLSTTTKHLKALGIRVSVPELETNCRTKLLQQQMGDLLKWGTPVQSIATRPFPAWTPPSLLNPFNLLHLGSTPFNEGSCPVRTAA